MTATAWCVFLAVILLSFVATSTYRLPKRFLERGCRGRDWRRRFPNASKQSIRRFLRVFIDAFGLPRRHELRFSPNDKILDVYAAMYPVRGMPDELEVETFLEEVRRQYGVNLDDAKADTTLGEIFTAITVTAEGSRGMA